MKEFKAGDLIKTNKSVKITIPKGDAFEVIEKYVNGALLVRFDFLVNQSEVSLVSDLVESDYPKSNRKKLHDYIKSTGYTSVKLGESVGNKWYFSNITKKSRLDSRGDISDGAYQFHKAKVVALVLNLNNQKPEKQSTVSDESVSDARKEEIIRELDLMQGRTVIVNNYQEKQANWNKLNKIAFLICVLFLISILTILYSVVSK